MVRLGEVVILIDGPVVLFLKFEVDWLVLSNCTKWL